jgi:hypothetical protein
VNAVSCNDQVKIPSTQVSGDGIDEVGLFKVNETVTDDAVIEWVRAFNVQRRIELNRQVRITPTRKEPRVLEKLSNDLTPRTGVSPELAFNKNRTSVRGNAKDVDPDVPSKPKFPAYRNERACSRLDPIERHEYRMLE